jgi:SpoVK/Ycf46/Vps4 family AAA+-type ATPase
MEAVKELKTWLLNHAKPSNDKVVKPVKKTGYQVLFTGHSNNKVATAEALAREAGKEVHRIDLSQVVSRYIGETEKNLDAVFKKAAGKDWVLFFDEADALFGKRTEVKDAHDKFANQEVNYLLQRMESYAGLVILATNLKANIDKAFTRRFQTVVHFPIP